MVEQRYQAVLKVLDGSPVTEVAERFGVARQTRALLGARYRDSGPDGLADRSHAPKAYPWRISAEVEAVICDLRGSHRRWGPRRLVFELAKRGYPVSRSTVYRVLVRHQLLQPVPWRRRRDPYRRWVRRPGRPRPVRRHPDPHYRLPVPQESRSRLRGARAGSAQPPHLPEPVTVTRRVSVRGAIPLGGQKIQASLAHARKTAEVTAEADTYQITIEPGITITEPRATSRDTRPHKASNYQPG